MQTPSELFDIKNFVIFITLIGSYRFDGIDGRGLLKTAKRLKFTAKMPMFRLGFTKLSNSNLKRKQGNMTLTLNKFEGQWSFIQNDLDNMKVKCTKFEVSISISVEVIENYLIQEIT